MEANKIKIKTLAISLAAIIATEFLARIVMTKGPYHPMVILGVTRLVEACLILIVVIVWNGGMSSIGWSYREFIPGIKQGLMWSVAFGLPAFIAFVFLFALGTDPLRFIYTRLPAKPADIALFFLVGGLAGPVAEEFFFRGVVYGFFRRWGVLAAIVLSTLAFVLVHPSAFQGFPLAQVVGGIVFAVTYELEKNIVVPITVHVLGNTAIFSLSLLSS
jgi:membrane protease YdiL (CAAX protease family)